MTAAVPVSPESLKGKLKELHDALPEGERGVFLEALGSPSMPAETLCWGLQQLEAPVSISPSLVRTFRRRHRREAVDMQGV